jgi:hypothetical protein
MRRRLLSFFLLAILLANCDSDKKSDCSNIFCSQEFRIITVLIRHASDSTAFILTDYKVFRVSDNKDLTLVNNTFPENAGYYPLVDDSDFKLLRNINTEIEFQGYSGNNQVVKKRFVVTADCCHVSLVTGESVIYI